ncbi:Fur family transcriptional regulator [Treponema sp.]|uniref:Fur family transcriptional regulator n=1 Tax=Treponema sp. TaxID=166 RepID=UPI003F0BE4A8
MNQDKIAAMLEEKNIRPSIQRMAIYKFLAENPVHPTVDTIYTSLSPKMPTLSRTTVYNTLRQFSECGLVQTITIEDGELRYDADTSNHLHFKCTKCGKIFDIAGSTGSPQDFLPHGFTAKKVQTNIWGTCSGCS